MKDIIEENYNSIVKRGLIKPTTLREEFVNKLLEEVKEFTDVFDEKMLIDETELADIILVCFNIARHYGIDIEKELKKKIEINKNR